MWKRTSWGMRGSLRSPAKCSRAPRSANSRPRRRIISSQNSIRNCTSDRDRRQFSVENDENGEPLDPQFQGLLQNVQQGVLPGHVPGDAGESPSLRPAAVAVQNHPHMAGNHPAHCSAGTDRKLRSRWYSRKRQTTFIAWSDRSSVVWGRSSNSARARFRRCSVTPPTSRTEPCVRHRSHTTPPPSKWNLVSRSRPSASGAPVKRRRHPHNLGQAEEEGGAQTRDVPGGGEHLQALGQQLEQPPGALLGLGNRVHRVHHHRRRQETIQVPTAIRDRRPPRSPR